MSTNAPEPPIIDYEEFRDHIATVDDEGNRKWLYPKKPKGRYHTRRVVVAITLLAMFFIGPFLKYNGQPLLLFNLLDRKFIIFGLTFWPQDFHLFALALVTFFVFIILFTVIFGRLWCGWACPQTIFMEMVFRKIEYWIEGDSAAQRKLAKSSWDGKKIYKRTLKYVIFALIAFVVGNLVMAYIIGVDELGKLITEGPDQNWGKFTFVMIFSGLFFFVFTYLREQACIAICPYGRLQGVLLDQDSIVVAYDHVRGEPRQRVKRGEERDAGDCVACGLCVQVCPTGIDIKDGTQLECVNCTACIDACDEVMDKVGFKRGLIRLASIKSITEGVPFRLTTRVYAYSVVLVVLLGILGFSLGTRNDVEATILRSRGTIYQIDDEGYVSNLYNVQIANKTRNAYPITIRLKNMEGVVEVVGKSIEVGPQEISKGAFFVKIKKEELLDAKTEIVLGVYGDEDKPVDEVSTIFSGPMKLKRKK